MATARVITIAQQKGGSGKTTLAANLGVMLAAAGKRVAFLDIDPQGSLGRWFMLRLEAGRCDGLDFSTASAWGVGFECTKLRKQSDIIIIDTPPKVDADLRPALREADLVLVPIASSQVDVWATDGVIDLARRAGREVSVVINRARPNTRLAQDVAAAVGELDARVCTAQIGNRVAYAESIGQGLAAIELGRTPALRQELDALTAEVLASLEQR